MKMVFQHGCHVENVFLFIVIIYKPDKFWMFFVYKLVELWYIRAVRLVYRHSIVYQMPVLITMNKDLLPFLICLVFKFVYLLPVELKPKNQAENENSEGF